MTDYTRHHVLITGGGSGIGLAIARAFSAAGARVSITGRGEARLKQATGELKGAQFAMMDVTDETSVKRAVGKLTKKFGPVSILVNNAGAAASAPLAKMNMDLWQGMLGVNLTGAYLTARAVVVGMQERNQGRIINIASTAGLKGVAYTSAYCAAKHGVIGLTRALAIELARNSITVNAVCPGFTRTAMVDQAVENIVKKTSLDETQALAELVKHNPGGRLIEPEEVADVVMYLASDDAAMVTGQAITVAGGEV